MSAIDTQQQQILSYADLLKMKRWNTPTIYNGWEQVTRRSPARDCVNAELTTDYMPQMGPMVGYAVTLVVEPSNKAHVKSESWTSYWQYVASLPAPKIVVVQDLDKPEVSGACWGEVLANCHRALGCVGTITDGTVRDVDEMTNAGFKAISRGLSVGHAHLCPMRWNVGVNVFGKRVQPNDLIHADKHGFIILPADDQPGLLDALKFMDDNECETVIPGARQTFGLHANEILAQFNTAREQFAQNTQARFNRRGEW